MTDAGCSLYNMHMRGSYNGSTVTKFSIANNYITMTIYITEAKEISVSPNSSKEARFEEIGGIITDPLY